MIIENQKKYKALFLEKTSYKNNLYAAFLETKLDTLVALADHKSLYLLDFIEGRYLKRHCEQIQKETESNIVLGRTSIIDLLEKELQLYFEGKLKEFKTPVILQGTTFQKIVWRTLQEIPYGEIFSYSKLARSINKPQSFRAVACANSTNKLAVIIPCHRVINASGSLGGYSGGIKNKQWLLNHEK